jgi:hypothetical protein
MEFLKGFKSLDEFFRIVGWGLVFDIETGVLKRIVRE